MTNDKLHGRTDRLKPDSQAKDARQRILRLRVRLRFAGGQFLSGALLACLCWSSLISSQAFAGQLKEANGHFRQYEKIPENYKQMAWSHRRLKQPNQAITLYGQVPWEASIASAAGPTLSRLTGVVSMQR